MAARVEKRTLGDLVEAKMASLQTGPFGTALKAAEYSDSGVPLISVREIRAGHVELHADTPRVGPETTARLRKFLLETGDIVFGRKGGVDRNARISESQDGWFLGSDGIRLRLSEEIDSSFVGYQLRSPEVRAWLIQHAGGSTMPSLNQRILHALPLSIPPLEVQRKVAIVLGSFDDKIELNRRTNETLEAMARALFRSWFVDFDPVHAKAKGEEPVGMDAETAALFPSELQDSAMGPIPKGWQCAPLRSWVEVLSGGTPSKQNPEYWNGSIPWVSPKVMTSIHVEDADNRVTESAIGNGIRMAPAGATLIMVRGMGLHKEVRISQATRALAFNQDVKALVAKDVDPTILLLCLLSAQKHLHARVESSGHGTGRLPSDVLLSLPLALPPLERQRDFARPFEAFCSRMISLRRESQTLATLRDTMLPRLISGQLRIPLEEASVNTYSE